jgi:hypothetical protein
MYKRFSAASWGAFSGVPGALPARAKLLSTRGMVSAGVLSFSPSERSEDISAVASFLPCSRSMWRRASRCASSHSICTKLINFNLT